MVNCVERLFQIDKTSHGTLVLIPSYRSLVNFTIVSTVEWPGLKPPCFASNRLFSSRYFNNLLWTTRSSNLPIKGSSDTGRKLLTSDGSPDFIKLDDNNYASKISASECQNSLIIDDFMEVAINRILTNQQIPETLPGPALWHHVGSQKWCCTLVEPTWRHTTRGRISLVMGHCNSCLGKVSVNEGTTAIPVTVEGHQGKFKNSKGASRQTMQLLSFDKLHLLKVKGWERRCRFGVTLIWELYWTVFTSKNLADDR